MNKSENTGRFWIIDEESGRKFLVEPIGSPRTEFGDSIKNENQAKGSIKESESIITKENGFKNILTLEKGVSPIDFIEKHFLNSKL